MVPFAPATEEAGVSDGEAERQDEVPGGSRPDDPYSRAQYRKLIAWEKRIAREAPLFERLLDEAPDRSLLDLGCGSGEHTAWFARRGARAVGLDLSEAMIESAREHEARGEGRFVVGDALDPRAALPAERPFGLALCLGNMLPHVTTDAELAAFVRGARAMLVPGGRLLIQILNYARLLKDDVNVLPVNIRPGEREDERIVFLRLMAKAPGDGVLFFPTTLTLDLENEDHPVAVHTTRRVALRAWDAAALTAAFEAEDFRVTLWGDMQAGPYDAEASHDLVLLAERSA